MKAFLSRVLRFLWRTAVVLVLLYLTVAMVSALVAMPLAFDRESVVKPTALGFGIGLAVFALCSRFLFLYVVGHELTHWLTAKLFLRETGDITVGKEGGNVAIDKPNIWITLAPYSLPVYTLIWIGLYGLYCLIRRPLEPTPGITTALYAGVGATYAFHVVLTTVTLLREQSDIKAYGRVLSLSLIAFCNVLVVFVLLLLASRQWTSGWHLCYDRLVVQWEFLVAGYWWIHDQVRRLF